MKIVTILLIERILILLRNNLRRLKANTNDKQVMTLIVNKSLVHLVRKIWTILTYCLKSKISYRYHQNKRVL